MLVSARHQRTHATPRDPARELMVGRWDRWSANRMRGDHALVNTPDPKRYGAPIIHAIELIFSARPSSERLHQAALTVLLQKTRLLAKLTGRDLHAGKVQWEPDGGATDLLVEATNGKLPTPSTPTRPPRSASSPTATSSPSPS